MSKASHLSSAAARLLANMNFTHTSAIAAGTTTSTLDSTGTGVATVDGVTYAISAQNERVLTALKASDLPAAQANYVQPSGLTGFYDQPANTTVYYVFGITASSSTNWLVVQGTFDPRSDQGSTLDPMAAGPTGGVFGGLGMGKSVIPDVPDGFTPVLVLKMESGASKFVPATTALTGLVGSFKSVSVLPVGSTF